MGETKTAVLDSDVIISCSVNKEVSNYIQKQILNYVFKKNENPMGFYPLNKPEDQWSCKRSPDTCILA